MELYPQGPSPGMLTNLYSTPKQSFRHKNTGTPEHENTGAE